LPKGVRAVPRMAVLGMKWIVSLVAAGRLRIAA
jgi:hypothetical protein